MNKLLLSLIFLSVSLLLPGRAFAIGSFDASNVVVTRDQVQFNIANLDRSNDGDHGGYDGHVIFATIYCSDTDSTVALPNGNGSYNIDDLVSFSSTNYDGSSHTGCVARIYTNEGQNDYQSRQSFSISDPLEPVTVTLNDQADTYVRSGQSNQNEGASQFMQIQSSGNNRALVKFDQTAIQTAIGNHTLLSATLQLRITDNGNNWGTEGRTVDVHRLIQDWTEGNGTDNNRGTGSGATWNCATDSQIQNILKNCSGTTEWEMGQPNNPSVHPWIEFATDSQTISNNQTGVITYDVTTDVQAFLTGTNNYGWLLKKTNEGQPGQVQFGTKESSYVPQLMITYQP